MNDTVLVANLENKLQEKLGKLVMENQIKKDLNIRTLAKQCVQSRKETTAGNMKLAAERKLGAFYVHKRN